jgi:hypothetical protein
MGPWEAQILMVASFVVTVPLIMCISSDLI